MHQERKARVSVSYTHLDVYKRQIVYRAITIGLDPDATILARGQTLRSNKATATRGGTVFVRSGLIRGYLKSLPLATEDTRRVYPYHGLTARKMLTVLCTSCKRLI